jgi:hypothetical protein
LWHGGFEEQDFLEVISAWRIAPKVLLPAPGRQAVKNDSLCQK